MNLFEFIAFRVMKKHNDAMLVAELRQCRIELLHLLETALVLFRVVGARQALQAITRQEAFLDRLHAAPGKAPLLIDKKVVHNAAQPRPGLVDAHEVVEFAEGLDQEFLEQVFGLGLAPGQAKREPVQPVEVWPDQGVESLRAIVDRCGPWVAERLFHHRVRL